MTIKKRVSVVAAVATGALLLASCSPGDLVDRAAGEAAERAIESATGSDIEVDEDGGSMSFEHDDGDTEISFGNATELPDGFPSEVPLIDGNIVTAAKTTQEGGEMYTVNIESGGSLSDARAEATELLLDAGFTEAETVELGEEMQMVTFEGQGAVKSVMVNLLGDGEMLSVGYMVYMN